MHRNIKTIEDAGIAAYDYVLIHKAQAVQGSCIQQGGAEEISVRLFPGK